MSTPLLPPVIAAALMIASLPPFAWGLAGSLAIPSLSFPTGFHSEEILQVLSDRSFSFLGGQYINAGSKLRYGGTAAQLNDFLAKLAACPGIKVSVSFSEDIEAGAREQKPGELPDYALSVFTGEWKADAWNLSHSAWVDPASLHVTVNSKMIGKPFVKVPQ